MEVPHSQPGEVRLISVEAAYPLRHSVLRAGYPPETARFDGDFEPYTFHLGVLLEDRTVGCATYLKRSSPQFAAAGQYQLRGMAVLPAYQGRGLGRLLLEHAYPMITAAGVRLLWCNARVTALRFYESQGFHAVGERFETPLAGPHFVMYKEL